MAWAVVSRVVFVIWFILPQTLAIISPYCSFSALMKAWTSSDPGRDLELLLLRTIMDASAEPNSRQSMMSASRATNE